MTYQRFEDVPVWQEAIRLGQAIYAFTQERPFRHQYSLRDQLERAAVSVSNNIAEGFERGTTPELITFLYYARGSAGEVRSMLWLIEGLAAFADLKFQIANLKSLSESCSRQLRAWADSLQNSEIKGQRHLTKASRQRDEAAKRALAFQEKLKQMVPGRNESEI
ncbi:MAG: four helix bundle protein [Verrucomicrobiaceae bacterium]|nr:four helix bundle protein [Verrucomicrobiaceae bacterium]